MAPPPHDSEEERTIHSHPSFATLAQVKVAELHRNKQHAVLYTSPLGRACYRLDKEKTQECLNELEKHKLLEAGLVYTSEVRPVSDDRPLSSKEWRSFQAEIGCQPLLLAATACAQELERLRAESAPAEKEKAAQVLTGDIVKLLVNHGAQLNMVDVGPLENTALHVAAQSGAAKLLSLLLILGADAGVTDGNGCTAEVVARRAGHAICEQILQVALMDRAVKEEDVLPDLERPTGKDWRRLKRRLQRQRDRAEEQESENSDDMIELDAQGNFIQPGSSGEQTRTRRIRGTTYGRDGLWSRLDEDLYPDADEWEEESLDDERWENDSANFEYDEDEDEDQNIRKQVERLRQEQESSQQTLQSVSSEKDALAEEARRLEKKSAKLQQRLATLRDRLARSEAGDRTAQDDIATEQEVSIWWQQRATQHARETAELSQALAVQREEQADAARGLEKEVRDIERRTKGLEEYWEQFLEAEAATEIIDCIAAEQRARQLEEEIASLEGLTLAAASSPALSSTSSAAPEGRLPRVLQRRCEEGPRGLAPLEELVLAVKMQRKVHASRRERDLLSRDMFEFCNSKLAEKDEGILKLIEEKLIEEILPRLNVDDWSEPWKKLALLVQQSREKLGEAAKSTPVSARKGNSAASDRRRGAKAGVGGGEAPISGATRSGDGLPEQAVASRSEATSATRNEASEEEGEWRRAARNHQLAIAQGFLETNTTSNPSKKRGSRGGRSKPKAERDAVKPS